MCVCGCVGKRQERGRCGRERGGVGLLGRLSSAGLRHGSAFRKVNEFAVADDSDIETLITFDKSTCTSLAGIRQLVLCR